MMIRRMVIAAILICAVGAAQAVFAQSDDGEIDAASAAIDTDDTDNAVDTVGDADLPKKTKKSEKSAASVEPATDVAAVKAKKSGELAKAQSPPNKKKKGEGKKDNRKKFQPSVKTSGLVIAGVDIHNKIKTSDTTTGYNRLARAEIEFSARPAKRVRAELGIKYNIKDTGIAFDKAYAQYNITDNGLVRAGIMKKPFGLEERSGLDERYFYKRSIINDALDDFGFLDHDLTLMYRHEIGAAWRVAGGFSWSVADSLRYPKNVDSLRYLQNYAVQYNMSDSAMFVLAAIVMHSWDKYYPGFQSTTFASSLSFRHIAAICESEAELTFGTNPDSKSSTIIVLNDGRWAMLFGARVQERFPIVVDTKIVRELIPIVEAVFYTGDTGSDRFDTQLRVGLTLGFAKNSAFQFRNNFGTVIRSEDGKSWVSRNRFDSEIAVIF